MNTLTLCADDYAMNKGISKGILALAQKRRINAISCITNGPFWKHDSKALLELNSDCQIGCHLNLTQASPLHKVIRRSYLKQWHVPELESEINTQLDQFEEGMQRAPDFIDGHQHIHQLPQIREALLNVYQKRAMSAWVRTTVSASSFPALSKKMLITFLGGAKWKKILQREGISHNIAFSGIYNFNKQVPYRRYFRRFLHELASSGGVIMCHPGLPSNDPKDTHAYARFFEWHYFNSNEFLADLNEYELVL